MSVVINGTTGITTPDVDTTDLTLTGDFNGVDATLTGNLTGVDAILSGGIVFGDAGGSGTSTSNTLDSYEEGTWTPYIEGHSTAGTGTYSAQDASYVKIGSLVFLNFDYSLSEHTGSGYYRLRGLPFASSSISGLEFTGSCMVQNFNTSHSLGTLVPYMGNGVSEMRLYVSNDSDDWRHQSLDGSHSLIGTITYRTDA